MGERKLTQNLLQLHDTAVCSDAMDGLRLRGINLLDDLLIDGGSGLRIRHDCTCVVVVVW